jgi:hypothetical protein
MTLYNLRGFEALKGKSLPSKAWKSLFHAVLGHVFGLQANGYMRKQLLK